MMCGCNGRCKVVLRLDHADHRWALFGPDGERGRFADHVNKIPQHRFGRLERFESGESFDADLKSSRPQIVLGALAGLHRQPGADQADEISVHLCRRHADLVRNLGKFQRTVSLNHCVQNFSCNLNGLNTALVGFACRVPGSVESIHTCCVLYQGHPGGVLNFVLTCFSSAINVTYISKHYE